MRFDGLLVAIGSAIVLQGCAFGPTKRVTEYPYLIIDYEKMTASSAGWSFPLRDCSNEEMECLEAERRFLIAFPRKCPNRAYRWAIEGGALRATAPMPHWPPPSGGYFHEKYPYVYLSYRAGFGFDTLWVQSRPVPSDNWGFPSVASYSLRFVGGEGAFVCKEGNPSP